MQPEPRRSVHVERAVDASRPRQPQRHDGRQPDRPRRLAVEARRRRPHRPHPTGLRSQALRRVRFLGRRQFGDPASVAGCAAPADAADDEANVLAAREPTTITHRRGKTKLLAPGEEEESGVSKIGRAAAKLCRLAFELAKAPDVAAMAELALGGPGRGDADRRRRVAAACRPAPRASRAAKTWKSSPPAVPRDIATTAFRTSWPRPSCAKAKRCWRGT